MQKTNKCEVPSPMKRGEKNRFQFCIKIFTLSLIIFSIIVNENVGENPI